MPRVKIQPEKLLDIFMLAIVIEIIELGLVKFEPTCKSNKLQKRPCK
uniref:Uncharacterized protein n=1 Tax=Vibrio tasmaniensis TaxID=212663 RepID=A0A0H4A2A0_9VIBR|nr:hypothetical protein [Vibrio tasmaniensis]